MANSVDSRNAYIFTHEGCINHACAVQTKERLQSFGVVPVLLPDPSYLEKALLSDSRGVLIIPGGRTGMLTAYLENQIDKIKSAVDRGWNYHGTCSGANFACKEFTIADSWPSRSDENHAKYLPWLRMLPVEACFPEYMIKKHADNGRKYSFVTSDGEYFTAFWNEGSFLVPKSSDVQVTASYADISGHPAAAVVGKYGEGIVSIMSLHPEIQGFPLADPITSSDDTAKTRELFLRRSFQSVGIL